MLKFNSFIALFLSLIIISYSCKKENEAIEKKHFKSFLPHQKGNYWIYENYRLNHDGTEVKLNYTDSVYVGKDTVINSKKYFTLYANGGVRPEKIWRDSAHYMIDLYGEIQFSLRDRDTTLYEAYHYNSHNNEIIAIEKKMLGSNEIYTCEAGTFNTATHILYIDFVDSNFHGQTPRINTRRFSQGVGIVSEGKGIFMVPDFEDERRLLRYHLE